VPAAIPAVAAFAATSATAAAIVQIATIVVTNIIVGAITRALTKKPKQFVPAINVSVRNSTENRRIVFGKRRLGGSFVYINTSSSGGNKADLLWYVIALAGHEISSIGDVYLDNERVASADINPSTGAVTGSTRFVGKLKIFKFLGTSSQAVQADLNTAFVEITTDFRLRGTPYLVLQMTRDDVAFFQGPPQSVTAICECAKYYDQRLDSTAGGSGSHRKTDPSTWTYGRNPAWMIRWYLTGGSVHNTGETTRLIRYGLKESDDRIDDSYFIAAANICDETLTGAEITPGGVGVRYQANAEFSTGESHRAILQELLDAMAGTLVYVHGKWRLYAGAYDSPTHSFTQEDLYGELEVSDTTDGDERYNRVAAVFIDEAAGYAEATTMFRTDSAYETQDGGEAIEREIDLRAVTNRYQADRLAEIELRRSRMMRKIVMHGALNMMKLAPWETFTLSHARYGWSNRVFRCVEKQFDFGSEAGKVMITAVQESSAVYNDLLNADYVTGTSATDEFKVEVPDPPTSLIAETHVGSVRLIVGLPASFPIGGSKIQIFEHTASTPFSSAVLVAEGFLDTFVLQRRQDTTTRFYWARIKTRSGAVSDTFPASTGASGVAALSSTLDLVPNAATDLYITSISTGTEPGATAGNELTINVPSMSRAYSVAASASGAITGNVNGVGAPSTKISIKCSVATPNQVGLVTIESTRRIISIQGDMTVPASTAATFTLSFDDLTGVSNPIGIKFEATSLKVEVIKA
jgi:hypothetical protein